MCVGDSQKPKKMLFWEGQGKKEVRQTGKTYRCRLVWQTNQVELFII
jgi:hypothetical protein